MPIIRVIDNDTQNRNNNLFEPCSQGDLSAVKKLITQDININAKTKNGHTALMLAALNGHTDIVTYLIKNGANINAKAKNGSTALMLAALQGHTDIVIYLVDKKANINAKTNSGCTALILAALKSHTDTVRCLIKNGANINAKTKNGLTVRMVANKENNSTVHYLLTAQYLASKKTRASNHFRFLFNQTDEVRTQRFRTIDTDVIIGLCKNIEKAYPFLKAWDKERRAFKEFCAKNSNNGIVPQYSEQEFQKYRTKLQNVCDLMYNNSAQLKLPKELINIIYGYVSELDTSQLLQALNLIYNKHDSQVLKTGYYLDTLVRGINTPEQLADYLELIKKEPTANKTTGTKRSRSETTIADPAEHQNKVQKTRKNQLLHDVSPSR